MRKFSEKKMRKYNEGHLYRKEQKREKTKWDIYKEREIERHTEKEEGGRGERKRESLWHFSAVGIANVIISEKRWPFRSFLFYCT